MILENFAFVDALLVVLLLLGHEPVKDNFQGIGKDLDGPLLLDNKIGNQSVLALRIKGR